ncbi:hypothetical protein SPRG_17631 [Saprolegnia parasitica CBS 223.65]|uniref:Bacterial transcriptional activator domain-containing protein n=1 Tax=Saprolegnia parasitica (strain CBS 223.65) TaxID=695850 RepID=A0A067BJK1_SAPPC|nr:hypothetical protein SPRG_17631 [Saprolegnia parasitica CBS 223.65]KDO16905.1 hypothetical protein SPRG_17631 [Saprolegnia parasitica CBS 223.65]|eukprot:XP_012212387.1 hypothetical protein SPRG_17631 [Saprolegnia parasitica CBS 223.65]
MEYVHTQCLEIYNNAALLTSGLHRFPDSVTLLMNAAQVAQDRGNDAEAYSFYLKGLAIDPTIESLLAKYANRAPKLANPLQSGTAAHGRLVERVDHEEAKRF